MTSLVSGPTTSVKSFFKTLNNHHSAIKLKHTIDQRQINFLDTSFFSPSTTSYTNLLTKVYFKATDTHALLHKNSYHPKHTFQGILKSQIIWFHRISEHSDFNSAVSLLFKSLRNRGYSKHFFCYIKNNTLATLAPTLSHTHTATLTTTPHTTPTPFDQNPNLPSPYPNLNPYPKQGLYPNPNPNLSPPGPNPQPDTNPPTPNPHTNPNLNPLPTDPKWIHLLKMIEPTGLNEKY